MESEPINNNDSQDTVSTPEQTRPVWDSLTREEKIQEIERKFWEDLRRDIKNFGIYPEEREK